MYDGSGTYKGSRAVRWDASGTAATELGHLGADAGGETSSAAFAINSAGEAVGTASNFNDAGNWLSDHAVYWGLDGVAIDLNTLIDPASGWTSHEARAISDTGWISGWGTFDPDGLGGQSGYHRLFLVQVPEPTSLALLSLGVLALRRRRRHYNKCL